MIRKKKSYSKPKKAYESKRIAEENKLVEKYGLKNKREIWKTIAKIKYFRKRAMELAKSTKEEQENLLSKLRALGLKTESLADILGLKVEDLLDRRLTTIVLRKNLASTAKHSRQMVVHKKILVNKAVIDSPSYIVPVELEDKISLKQKSKKPKVEAKAEEKKEIASEQPASEEQKHTASSEHKHPAPKSDNSLTEVKKQAEEIKK